MILMQDTKNSKNYSYQNNKSGDALAAQIAAQSYADREAQRQRSEIKNRALAKHEVALAKAEMRITNLEEATEKLENILDGGSLGLGLSSMCLTQGKELADLRVDFEKYIKRQEEQRGFNLQKIAVIVGVISTLLSASIPVAVEMFVTPQIKAIQTEVKKS